MVIQGKLILYTISIVIYKKKFKNICDKLGASEIRDFTENKLYGLYRKVVFCSNLPRITLTLF